MVKEIEWHPIQGFEDSYELNWNGEVRSIDRMFKDPKTGKMKFRKGRTIKQSNNAKGSPQVVLVKEDGRRKTVRVYTLMMEIFGEVAGGADRAEKFITNEDNPGRGKIYEFFNPEGEYVRVQNLSKFCKENDLHTSNLCQVHAGKLNSCKGWKKFTGTGSLNVEED